MQQWLYSPALEEGEAPEILSAGEALGGSGIPEKPSLRGHHCLGSHPSHANPCSMVFNLYLSSHYVATLCAGGGEVHGCGYQSAKCCSPAGQLTNLLSEMPGVGEGQ